MRGQTEYPMTGGAGGGWESRISRILRWGVVKYCNYSGVRCWFWEGGGGGTRGRFINSLTELAPRGARSFTFPRGDARKINESVLEYLIHCIYSSNFRAEFSQTNIFRLESWFKTYINFNAGCGGGACNCDLSVFCLGDFTNWNASNFTNSNQIGLLNVCITEKGMKVILVCYFNCCILVILHCWYW